MINCDQEQAQVWLSKHYPDQVQTTKIKFRTYQDSEIIQYIGDLIINNYPNLAIIKLDFILGYDKFTLFFLATSAEIS